MNLRSTGYWLLLITCTVLWPGCAQPVFQRPASNETASARPRAGRGNRHEGQVSLARLTERSGQTEQARRMYMALIEKRAGDPLPYHRLGVMAAQDRKWRAAEQYFNQAYALNPSSTELLSDMGYFYYLQNRHQEAENILRQALALDADDRAANNNLGLVLSQQQRYEESFAAFRQAGTEAEARANLAFVLAQQGQYDQALEAYSRALSLDQKLRPAAVAMLQLAHHRPNAPGKEANDPTSQLAAHQRPAGQQPNDAAAAASDRSESVSDLPPRPYALSQGVAAAGPRAGKGRAGRRAPVQEETVVVENRQRGRAAMPRPLEQVRVTVSHGDEAISFKADEAVPFKAALPPPLNAREQAELKVATVVESEFDIHQPTELHQPGAGRLPSVARRGNDEAPVAAPTATISAGPLLPLPAPQEAVPTVVAGGADGKSSAGGHAIQDGAVIAANAQQERVARDQVANKPLRRDGKTRPAPKKGPELAVHETVRTESPADVPIIAFKSESPVGVKTGGGPEFTSKLGRLGIEP